MLAGSHGVISVAANIFPKEVSSICRNVLDGNVNEAERLNLLLSSFYDYLFVESNPIPVKWMLAKMGKINNAIRLPLTELNETYHNDILSKLIELEIL
jgi:4-hydroxy-tetrahydrodipicolinate synthase